MKTKTIDVWVYKDHIKGGFDIGCKKRSYEPENESLFYKAKLIIEIPEQKIEITESEFDEICKNQDIKDGMDCYQEEFWSQFKKDLGFKDI